MHAISTAPHSLLITIVGGGKGSKVAETNCKLALYNAILRGRGTTHGRFCPMPGFDEDSRDVVFTLVYSDQVDALLKAADSRVILSRAGCGIAFVVPIHGIFSMLPKCSARNAEPFGAERSSPDMNAQNPYELIFTIVNRGHADEVVTAARAAGAEGSTILNARGTGIHENVSFLGISIEPEKEIVLTLIRKEIAESVMQSILKAADLNAPGKGIAFALGVERVAGVAHMKQAGSGEHGSSAESSQNSL